MKKSFTQKKEDFIAFFKYEGRDIFASCICFATLYRIIESSNSVINIVGIILTAIFLGVKLYDFYKLVDDYTKNEINFNSKIKELEKELSNCRDRINQKTEEITKLKKELEKSDDLLFRITGSKRN